MFHKQRDKQLFTSVTNHNNSLKLESLSRDYSHGKTHCRHQSIITLGIFLDNGRLELMM